MTAASLGPGTTLESFLELVPAAMVAVDDAGTITASNARARRLLRAGEDARGEKLAALLGIEEIPAGSARTVERLVEGTVQLVEISSAGERDGVRLFMMRAQAGAGADDALVQQEILFQKSLLESQTEAAFDGILVVDPEGRMLSFNRAFIEMWGIPDHVVSSRSDDAAVRSVLDKVVDPDAFLERVAYLYKHPLERSKDEIRLRDGRVFDRFSAPVVGPDGTYFGRVWFFHDVSELKRTEESLRFVAEASEVLSTSLEPRAILRQLAQLAVPRLADWCVLYALDEDGRIERVALEHADPSKRGVADQIQGFTLDPEASEGVPFVVRTGTAILRSEATPEMLASDVQASNELLDLIRDLGVRSWMCVPLAARGRILGAMSFMAAESGRTYTEADVRIGEELAHRAALAMDNAKLFQEKAHIARTLQESLLPPEMPEIPGIEIAPRYAAAGEGAEVGGDFYDVFSTGGHSWGVVIGDVLGKGPHAAALTALARYAVRTAAMRLRKPARILSVLNEAIYRQHGGSRFCTAVYVRLQERQRGVGITVARGGHPSPLILRADGTLEALSPGGALLGSFPEVELSQTATELFPGDSLVLYTDGVIEARGGDRMFGEDGLRTLLAGHAGASAGELADALERAVLDLQDGRPRDDVAIVVLRVSATVAAPDPVPARPRRGRRIAPAGDGRICEIATFEPDPSMLSNVRRFVGQVLSTWGLAALEETGVLLVHELTVNAIVHARSRFEVMLTRLDDRVRFEVSDSSAAPPRQQDPEPSSLGGRGLVLVGQLAEAWGVELRGRGKTVWFELLMSDERVGV